MQLFVDQLTVIDSAYLHPVHGIVGESWIVDAVLHGALDEQSMVMDFGQVKKQLKAAIDGSIDHTLIVPAKSNALQKSKHDDGIELTFTFGNNETLLHRSPANAITLLPVTDITTDAMARWLEQHLLQRVPNSVTRIDITLRHEDETPAHYHYAHGLKKHRGNCQRIAHGHRSRIRIWRNDVRDESLERAWAADWNYRYLATRADIAATTGTHHQFRYEGDQGAFVLHYPIARCHVIDTDSTVECIAQHIADTLGARHPGEAIRVQAYEGVQKGAISSPAP